MGAESPHSSALSDPELLAAHLAGDGEAFGALFHRHRDRLWAVALRTCNDPETAADGLQDALIAAFRRADSFRGDAAVTTWLHRIVVNACLDRLRSQKVRRADPLPEDLDEQHRRSRETSARLGEASDPAEHGLVLERRRQVRAALAALPAEQRAAVVLVDMEGYSVAEVAQILGCAEGTVKSRCSRGRARLAVLLRDMLADDDATPRMTETERNPGSAPHVGPMSARGPPPAATAPAAD